MAEPGEERRHPAQRDQEQRGKAHELARETVRTRQEPGERAQEAQDPHRREPDEQGNPATEQ
jgi:hypothetical protein